MLNRRTTKNYVVQKALWFIVNDCKREDQHFAELLAIEGSDDLVVVATAITAYWKMVPEKKACVWR